MSIDPKSLQALAIACRKAGIKHFKNAELEFTLTDEAPISEYKKNKKSNKKQQNASDYSTSNEEPIPSDILTQEELLFWSTGDVPEASAEGN